MDELDKLINERYEKKQDKFNFQELLELVEGVLDTDYLIEKEDRSPSIERGTSEQGGGTVCRWSHHQGRDNRFLSEQGYVPRERGELYR